MTIDYPFVASDVGLYHRMLSGTDNAVDAQTWDDLLLPAYSVELARETSVFGQQELHRRLQHTGHSAAPQGDAAAPPAAGAAGAAIGARVRGLLADEALRSRLQAACTGLRGADREISVTLYGADLPPSPRWLRALPLLPLTFLLSAGVALFTGWLALWGVALAAWLALMAIQMRYHEAVQQWERILNSARLMLRAHSLLAAIDHPSTATLREDAREAGQLNRRLGRSVLSQLPMMQDYADWLWLQNIRHFFRSRDEVRANIAYLRSSFARVAGMDADLALARHLSQPS